MSDAIYAHDDLHLPPCRMLRSGRLGDLAKDARTYPGHAGLAAKIADYCPDAGELAAFPAETAAAVAAEQRRRAAASQPLRHATELRAACDIGTMIDDLSDESWWHTARTMMRDQLVAAHKSGMMSHARAI